MTFSCFWKRTNRLK